MKNYQEIFEQLVHVCSHTDCSQHEVELIAHVTSLQAIVTHYRPDLDACLAVWAAKKLYKFWSTECEEIGVEFAPTSQVITEPRKMYVDMNCGIKEVAGKCASVYLCSLLPIGYQAALEIIGLLDDMPDTEGGNLSVLYVEQETFPVNPAVVNYTNAAIIITKIGHNIGIKRCRENIDLNELVRSGFKSDFFIHPSGFMACYGDMSGKGRQAEIECPITFQKIMTSCLDILKYSK